MPSNPVNFPRPSDARIRLALRFLAPWRAYTRPVFVGLDRLPARRPLLLVGNHTLLGVLDAPMLFEELYLRHNIFLRSLGDHAHFGIPGWRAMLHRYGVVDGTRENCAALMEAGEAILLFPGGAREVAKRKGEKYQLLWGNRLGFARMAIAHQCVIVPFAAVGVEDAFDIVKDADDFFATPLGKLARKHGLRSDFVPPLIRGIGPTPLPRPHRIYFHIGEPIEPEKFGTDPNNDEAAIALRDATKAAVEAGINNMLAFRELDPKRVRFRRLFDDTRARPRQTPHKNEPST